MARIVVGPDGTVLAASGAVPRDPIDRRLQDCDSLPSEVRASGASLLQRLRETDTRIVSQTIELDGGTSLEIVALEALALRRTPTHVRDLLTSKLAIISAQAEAAGVKLTIEVDHDVPAVVYLDSEKVAWAVTTLVGNALRYVQTPSRRLGGRLIQLRATRGTSEVTIEVRDDGPGIPADTVKRLFIRDGLNVRGSGLALLLVRDLVTAHGGTVDLQSRTEAVGHGTTIRLVFPIR
jgi:signal transduction histidine kinase